MNTSVGHTAMPGSESPRRSRLPLAVAALVVVAAVVVGVVQAGDVGARRAVFEDDSVSDYLANEDNRPEVAEVQSGPLVVEARAAGSAAFAALLTPFVPDGAVLSHNAHLTAGDGFEADEAWFELADGAVLLISRSYVGSDYHMPSAAALMGRSGGVEYWDNGIEAAVSATPYFAEIKAYVDGWLLTIAAQEGPVWFGEGEPPSGFFKEGRRGVVPDLSILRALARKIVDSESILSEG
ncbi:MAG: hypothetical protein JW785_03795 [Acidimicrobiia bacterium]|nr:hypothetical protein [Acidimicrobiia bacterium]